RFLLYVLVTLKYLHSFPTRRSSDLNMTVAGHLLKDYLFYGEADEMAEIKNGEGKTIKLDGDHLAAYRDEEGRLHIVSGICTHMRSEEHTSELQSRENLVCRLLLEKK